MNAAKTKLWTKDFVIITSTAFFVHFIFFMLMATITGYAMEEFHASESMAGFASSIFILGALLFRFFVGKYIDIIGRRRLTKAGLFLFMIVLPLYLGLDGLFFLLLVRFLHGGAYGIAVSTMTTAVMDMIPDDRKGEGIAFFTLSNILAIAAGPSIGFFSFNIRATKTCLCYVYFFPYLVLFSFYLLAYQKQR